jgi:hypothetical protein
MLGEGLHLIVVGSELGVLATSFVFAFGFRIDGAPLKINRV